MKKLTIAAGSLALALAASPAGAQCVPTAEHSGVAAYHFYCGDTWYGVLNTAPNASIVAGLVGRSLGTAPIAVQTYNAVPMPPAVPCNPDVCDGGKATPVQGVARYLPF